MEWISPDLRAQASYRAFASWAERECAGYATAG
jgi:hypothetical protein